MFSPHPKSEKDERITDPVELLAEIKKFFMLVAEIPIPSFSHTGSYSTHLYYGRQGREKDEIIKEMQIQNLQGAIQHLEKFVAELKEDEASFRKEAKIRLDKGVWYQSVYDGHIEAYA